MTKLYTGRVDHCAYCPNHEDRGGVLEECRCMVVGSDVPNCASIPDWCPLPEAEKEAERG